MGKVGGQGGPPNATNHLRTMPTGRTHTLPQGPNRNAGEMTEATFLWLYGLNLRRMSLARSRAHSLAQSRRCMDMGIVSLRRMPSSSESNEAARIGVPRGVPRSNANERASSERPGQGERADTGPSGDAARSSKPHVLHRPRDGHARDGAPRALRTSRRIVDVRRPPAERAAAASVGKVKAWRGGSGTRPNQTRAATAEIRTSSRRICHPESAQMGCRRKPRAAGLVSGLLATRPFPQPTHLAEDCQLLREPLLHEET